MSGARTRGRHNRGRATNPQTSALHGEMAEVFQHQATQLAAVLWAHEQKRLLVKGRLAEADAATLSDRAIARELGVSQPFVSAIRRSRPTGPTRTRAGSGGASNVATVASQTRSSDHNQFVPERITTAQQALDRAVAHRQLTRTRRASEAPTRALTEWDPFA